MRPADSTTLAAVTSAAVAAFDADIARAVDERASSVQRATDAEDIHSDDEMDDGQGELTLGQLVDDYGSHVSNGSQGSRASGGAHGKVR